MKPYQRVKDWMIAFGVPNDLVLQEKLIVEECIECLVEISKMDPATPEVCANVLKEVADVAFVHFGMLVMLDNLGELTFALQPESNHLLSSTQRLVVDIADEIEEARDLFEEAFVRVCESNMSKLDDDGKPVRNEDGKVLKGKNYKAPDLSDLAQTFCNLLKEGEDYAAEQNDQMILAASRVA